MLSISSWRRTRIILSLVWQFIILWKWRPAVIHGHTQCCFHSQHRAMFGPSCSWGSSCAMSTVSGSPWSTPRTSTSAWATKNTCEYCVAFFLSFFLLSIWIRRLLRMNVMRRKSKDIVDSNLGISKHSKLDAVWINCYRSMSLQLRDRLW